MRPAVTFIKSGVVNLVFLRPGTLPYGVASDATVASQSSASGRSAPIATEGCAGTGLRGRTVAHETSRSPNILPSVNIRTIRGQQISPRPLKILVVIRGSKNTAYSDPPMGRPEPSSLCSLCSLVAKIGRLHAQVEANPQESGTPPQTRATTDGKPW